jgi:hypothetical protein
MSAHSSCCASPSKDSANTYTLYLNGVAILTANETTAPVPNTQALVFGQSACRQQIFHGS